MSSSKAVAIFVSLLMSYIYAGTIHINGYAELPNGDSGTAGSEVRYKNITQNTLPVIGFLDAEGKYSVDLLVDPSGINHTTIGYSARAYGNNIIISGTDVERINVYNSKGQLVKKASFNAKNGITRGSFETGGLSTGLYFINVDTKSKSFTLKTNIFEGQSSLMPDLMSLPASKQGTGKSAKISNDFEVKILAPSGEFSAYTDTLTFSIPDTGEESWENPVHALSYNSPSRILGYVQKGPFITGSSVQIQELNNSLTPNGNTYNVSTEDNFGSFVLETLIPTKYIEVISTGFYFNEVSGSLSEANLTLRAIAETDKVLGCNVNILTSLAKKRIVYLVTTEGKTFTEAKIQAQNEILAVFSIDGTGAANFEDMDMSEDGDSNGMLLAVSAILQGNNTVAELSSLISTIIEDIKTDGILDNADAKNEIIENAKYLSLVSVRKNIEDRYKELGLTAVIPNFEQYINNIWANQPPTCQITKLECIVGPDTLSVFSGDPLLIGKLAQLSFSTTDIDGDILKTEIYLDNILKDSLFTGTYNWVINDTTKFHTVKVIAFDDDGAQSVDSINFQLYPYQWVETASNETLWDQNGSAPASISAVSLGDKMFVYNRDKGVICSSTNGTDWTTETSTVPWINGGYLLNSEYDNKIWLYVPDALFYSSDGINWIGKGVSRPPNLVEQNPFIYNDSLYSFFYDFSNSEVKIYKLVEDTFVVASPDFPDIEMSIAEVKVADFNNNLFIFNRQYGWVKMSQDLINWTTYDDILPFEINEVIAFNDKIYAFPSAYVEPYIPWMWKSYDCLNWSQDILWAPMLHRVIIFNGNIWAFNNDYEFNVYRLKKYFE